MGSVVTTIGARTGEAERNVARLGAAAKATAADLRGVGRDAGEAAKKVSTSSEAAAKKAASAARKQAAELARIRSEALHGVDDLSTKAGAVGAVAAAGVAVAVKTYADFDKAMSGVAAAAPDAKNQLSALRAEARRAGKETAFSAKEAAAGVENLIKAGVGATDVLGGGLQGALDLAAAGEMQVADAAEIAATAMTQFKLRGQDVPHIADLLVAAAGKAQGEVSDMGMALNQSGLVASQFGLSIEESTGSLAAFASAGLVGSDAGTSFRSMLLHLGNPTKESAALMKDLGIQVYDAQGNFVGMESLAGQLETRLGGLTQKQRDSALATIFGSDAIRAANVLYEEGADGIAEWTVKVNDAGYASDQARLKTDNLVGDLERLSGAWDDLMIGVGESANGPGRAIVQWLEDVVEGFAEMPSEVQAGTLLVIASIAGLGLSAAVVGKLVVAISEARTAMAALSAAAPVATGRLAGFARGATAAGLAVGAYVLAVKALGDAFYNGPALKGVEETRAALRGLAYELDATDLDKLFDVEVDAAGFNRTGQIVEGVENIGDAIRKLTSNDASDQVNRFMANIFAGLPVPNSWKDLKDQVAAVDTELAQMAQSGDYTTASQAVRKMADQYQLSYEQILSQFPEFHKALRDQALALEDQGNGFDASKITAEEYALWMRGIVPNSVREAAKAQSELNTSLGNTTQPALEAQEGLEDLTGQLNEQKRALQENIDAIFAQGNAMIGLSDAQIGYEEAVAQATKTAKENGAATKLNTEAGRENRTALNSLAGQATAYIQQLIEQGKSTKQITEQTQKSRDEFVKIATDMGYTKEQAKKLADQYGLVPKDVKTAVEAPGIKDTQAQIKELKEKIAELEGKYLEITADVKITGLGELKEIKSGVDKGMFKGGNKLVGPMGYSDGGWTGPGDKYAPAGIVHADEFVIQKESRRKFEAGHPGALDHLNQTGELPGYASGGRVDRKIILSTSASGDTEVDIHAPVNALADSIFNATYAAKTALMDDLKKSVKEAYAAGGLGGDYARIDVSNPRGLTTFRGHTFSNLAAATLRATEIDAGRTFVIFQGGYRPRTSYSGTSHQGDAIDARVDPTLMRAGIGHGLKLWDRTGRGDWASHMHGIFGPGAGFGAGSALWQWQDYLRGGDGLAGGGYVRGPGGPTDDAVPVWASNGEYVLREKAAKIIGPAMLARLNALGGPMAGYAAGGPVAPSTFGRSNAFDVSVIVRLIRELEQPIRDLSKLTADVAKARRELDASRGKGDPVRRAYERADARYQRARDARDDAKGDNAEQLKRARDRVAELEKEYRAAKKAADATKGKTQADRDAERIKDRLDAAKDRRDKISRGNTADLAKLNAQLTAAQKARTAAQEKLTAAEERNKAASDKLKDAQQELLQAQQEVANQARSMSDQFRNAYTAATTDVGSWADLMRTGTKDLATFLGQIKTLRGRGLSETLVQQILGMGAQSGGELAGQIIAGGKPLVGELNKVSQGLQDVADQLGYLGATGKGRYAAGGPVSGPGTGTSDSIVARLSDGEWVVPAHAVPANRRYLEAITYGEPQRTPPAMYARTGYAAGGPVTAPRIDTQALAAAVRDGLSGLELSARINGEWVDMRIDTRVGLLVNGLEGAH